MDLLYIWINEENNIKKQGFNLSNKYFIEYNHDTKVIKIDKNHNYFKGFFKLPNQKDGCSNLEIMGIIGANGTGKSTLLDVILAACTVFPSDLMVYEDDSQVKIFIHNNKIKDIKVEQNLDTEPVFVDDYPNNQEIIYYSNVFDYNSSLDYNIEVLDKRIHNISTNHLLNFSKYIDSESWSVTQRDSFRSDEITKQIIFVHEYKDAVAKLLTFDTPKKIEMKLSTLSGLKSNSEVIDSYYVNLGSHGTFEALEDISVFKDKFYLNIIIGLISEERYNNEIFIEIINRHLQKDDGCHFSNLVKKILEETSQAYSTAEKKEYIVAKINSKLHFIAQFETFLEVGSIINVRNDTNTITFDLDEFSYKMILECEKCFYVPVVLFDWYEMSSGEKSLLSMYTRFYDLIRGNQKLYDEIFILIDEVDTYLHPEWQRNMVNNLIIMCNEFFKEKDVKVIITSHSPFIVSDMPKDNIIFLYKEKEQIKVKVSLEERVDTFGANIHTLYSKAFFVNNTIGEFSNQKIKSVIKDLKEKSKAEILSIYGRKEEIEYVIESIGEPVIKGKLESLYRTTFPKRKVDYESQVAKLQEEKAELEESLRGKGLDKIENVMKLLDLKIRELKEKAGDTI